MLLMLLGIGIPVAVADNKEYERERLRVMKAISQVYPDFVSFKEAKDQAYPDFVEYRVLTRTGTEFDVFLKCVGDEYEVVGLRGFDGGTGAGRSFDAIAGLRKTEA